jgi:hypothetical protein
MTNSVTAIRNPIAVGFAAYGCAHVVLFAAVGLLGLPLPALFWGLGGLPIGWAASTWMARCGRVDLGTLIDVQTAAFAGGVLGLHGRELYCLAQAWL